MTKKKKEPRGWPGRPPIPAAFMAPCVVCGLDWPWPPAFATPQPVEKAFICQRCLMADLARVIRECPERFRYLHTIRALENLPLVVVWARSGDAEAEETKKCLS